GRARWSRRWKSSRPHLFLPRRAVFSKRRRLTAREILQRGRVHALALVPVVEAFVDHGEELDGVVTHRVGHAQGFSENHHHEQVLLFPPRSGERAPIGRDIELPQPVGEALPQAAIVVSGYHGLSL